MMMSTSKLVQALLAMTWGTFTASFMILLFFEKMVFNHYFNKTTDYIMLALVLAGLAILVSFASKFMPTRALAAIILGCIMMAMIIWFLILIDLPSIPNSSGCEWFSCQGTGQVIMIILHVGVFPALLIELTRRCTARSDEIADQADGHAQTGIFPALALALSGGILLVSGLVNSVGYYWTVFMAFMITAVMAISFVILFWKSHPTLAADARGNPDTNLFFRDLILVLLIGVPGFSMLGRDTYDFSLLTYFGTSMIAFCVVYYILDRMNREKTALFTMEGIVFAIVAVVISIMYYVNVPLVIVALPMGLPEFIIGFAVGYLWTRVYHVAQGITYPKAFPVPAVVDNTRNFSNKVATSLFLFGIVAFIALNLDPSQIDVLSIMYPVGLGISIVGLVLWTISAWKLKNR